MKSIIHIIVLLARLFPILARPMADGVHTPSSSLPLPRALENTASLWLSSSSSPLQVAWPTTTLNTLRTSYRPRQTRSAADSAKTGNDSRFPKTDGGNRPRGDDPPHPHVGGVNGNHEDDDIWYPKATSEEASSPGVYHNPFNRSSNSTAKRFRLIPNSKSSRTNSFRRTN